jgi:hypothetical protein
MNLAQQSLTGQGNESILLSISCLIALIVSHDLPSCGLFTLPVLLALRQVCFLERASASQARKLENNLHMSEDEGIQTS